MTPGQARLLRNAIGLIVIVLAAVALVRLLSELSLADLRQAWLGTPGVRIAGCLALTALSFTCLGAYEIFAARVVFGGRVRAHRAMQVGLAAHALSNTVGFHLLTGAAFRHRGYDTAKPTPVELARVLALVAACVLSGVVGVAILAAGWWTLHAHGWLPALVVILVAFVSALALVCRRRAAQHLTLLAQGARLLPVALLEMGSAIAALWVLLPPTITPPAAWFALVFTGALLLGLVSHSPGGLGVFEATILSVLPPGDQAQGLVALLLYRLMYNVLPFCIALACLPWLLRRQRGQLDGG